MMTMHQMGCESRSHVVANHKIIILFNFKEVVSAAPDVFNFTVLSYCLFRVMYLQTLKVSLNSP